ncbi:MOB kinase activator-like 1 [Histomonas meleagridis]|uniref:MOB kinase activator-like 1 n=1 Tax=Histomonas meleagridis TaxID=135588 RepID=UPI003559E0A9|nr:MOB kinase activator-like 1 [Histomonas meleagridis]KAH0799314.1 MOB kinase activator-like 1 [Histomonas meleagridis]
MNWFQSSSKATFKPMKKFFSNPKRQALQQHAMDTLGFGNMKEAVQLPEGEDLNEWLAVNVVDFYKQLSMLYATVTEFCTPETCPQMTAGPGYKYLWSDGRSKPRDVPACEYIKLLFEWVENQLDDEAIFPSMIGVSFPKNFESIVKNIMKRLFRIYAHCYYHHLENFKELGTMVHLNTSFKQFIYFTKEFNLIPQEQLDPLKDIIDGILKG